MNRRRHTGRPGSLNQLIMTEQKEQELGYILSAFVLELNKRYTEDVSDKFLIRLLQEMLHTEFSTWHGEDPVNKYYRIGCIIFESILEHSCNASGNGHHVAQSFADHCNKHDVKKFVTSKVFAPWTEEQVEKLKIWQRGNVVLPTNNGEVVLGFPTHPFTCCSHNGCKRNEQPDDGALIPTADGWTCPCGEYKQNWAHDFMMELK